LGNGSLAETAAIGNIDNSCSNQTTFWVTPHYSTDDGYIKGEWAPVFNVETYKVQISYSRDGIQPWQIVATFDTNRTEFRYVDPENGGRYLVRVRIKNTCDGMGPWSEALRIYVGGGSDPGAFSPPPPPPCEECNVLLPPPGDDDELPPPPPPGDGDDELPPPPPPGDGDDDVPPPPPGDEDDGNNGHGNDDDGDDESNPAGGGGIS
jgi:hypothetical protein